MHCHFRIPALIVALAASCLLLQPACAENTFEIPNVHVDASGSSTTEARMTAIASGRPVAWSMLFRRLTRQQDWGRQPTLDATQLEKMIIGYSPINERRSTTRYVADVTYTFNPEAVARVLQAAGIPYTAATAKRVLVIPLAPGFARNSMWTMAFASPRFALSAVPFAVPIGDAQDMAALAGLNLDTATWDEVAPVAARIHATEAVLVLATPAGNKLTVTLKRVGAGELPVKTSFDVPLLQGAASTYPGAADAAVRAIDDMWKNQKAVDYSQKAKLTADVRIDSLAQFASLESALSAVPNVASVGVAAMDIGQARLAISYIGTTDQLRVALAQAGITLSGRAGAWQISQGAAAGQP
jgi:Uncharacterized protein conserved in bacteria (DUF2066)